MKNFRDMLKFIGVDRNEFVRSLPAQLSSTRSSVEKMASRRQKFQDSARAELKETALELFAERGYAYVSFRDIAFAAGISERTLRRYFNVKEDFLLDGLLEGAVAFRRALRAVPKSLPPIDAFERALLAAEYPSYYLESLSAAVICSCESSNLFAMFNEFRRSWQDEVAAAIGEWRGVAEQTDFQPVFWASAIFTALKHTLRTRAGEAGIKAEFPEPVRVLKMAFDNLRLMTAASAPALGPPSRSAEASSPARRRRTSAKVNA